MAFSELQIGLIALGVVGVGGVFAYNKWQERKHRAHAERVFKQDHPDVLIGQGTQRHEPAADPAPPGLGEERIEPVIGDVPAAEPESAQAKAPAAQAASIPEIDPRIDCLVRFEAAEPVTGNDFWSAQRQAFELVDKPVRWFALDGGPGNWRVLDAHTAGRFQQFCCALQIADRRGPLSGGEMVSFFEGLQQLGDKFLAVVDYPQREAVLADANQLDAFCAGVDAQIAVHVVATQAPFPGAKVAALAGHAGLQLRGDGLFHAEEAAGSTLFTLGNLEAALFAAEQIEALQTHGVTLTVDVPRVADGVAAFDGMIALGLKLANNLGGELVDDNRSPLGEPALLKIRGTIGQFQQQMAQQGIAAGSATALRLFS